MTPACPRFTKIQQSIRHSSFSFPAMLDLADRPFANSHARKFCRVICIGAAVALLAGRIVHAEPASTSAAQVAPNPVAAPVAEAAQRSGIPASWIRAVMQAESGGAARAMSPKGAMGLMQIMPETWATLRLRYGLGTDPFDPHDNIHRRRCVSAGIARPLRIARLSGGLQCRSGALRGPSRNRPTASGGDACLRRTAGAADRHRRDRRDRDGGNRGPFLDRGAAVHRARRRTHRRQISLPPNSTPITMPTETGARGFDGARPAVGRPVCADIPPESAAMTGFTLHRRVGGLWDRFDRSESARAGKHDQRTAREKAGPPGGASGWLD